MHPDLIVDELRDLNKKVDRIQLTLDGNGTVGLKTRIDRLEQTEKRRSKFIWVMLLACGTSVLAAIKTFIGLKS